MAEDPEAVVAVCAEVGVDRLLTSGAHATALEGAQTIAKLVDAAADSGLIVMVCASYSAMIQVTPISDNLLLLPGRGRCH